MGNLAVKIEARLKVACLANASYLLKESNRLLKQGKYSLSAFLAITSFEESLKLGLLNMVGAKYLSELDFQKLWKGHVGKFRSRGTRIRFNLETSGQPELIFGSLEEAKEISRIRKDCLYVDFQGSVISQPKKIGIDKAVRFIQDATLELKSALLLKELERKLKKHFSG